MYIPYVYCRPYFADSSHKSFFDQFWASDFPQRLFSFFPSPGQEKMILEVEVVVVRQQYCKARYLQVGRELGKRVWEPCGSSLGSE